MPRQKEFDPDAAVAAAMDLFWANGYAATTPQQLVDALGIGRGSLYNAFGSKHELFERALQHYYDTHTTTLIETLEGTGTVRSRLRAALELVAGQAHDRGCLITNTAVEFTDPGDPVVATIRRVLDRQEQAFRATVEEGQRSGEIPREHDAGALAAFFLATTNGIQVLAKANHGPERLSALVETALRAL
ncbi:TetR/AcrR family transcriptional regulator [Actinokineospora bangkokensis]|uniref:TetR family transcriptional regulator n=1 Tax=Actinokineospora bangkokensis TaxID=1193682 RepID=A0A1Q9LTT0_9PSEU|nr:TetR/AcrR family transcriptional regulator [Actinokineospora bangkokensis]OLR95430.1 TetR family transcriptional regulator [Actinokineospora bangkokensis]